MSLGTVRARSGKTCAGIYQGSLLLSTPGQPHTPGSQAVRRCLIVYPDRVNADGLAKDRPRRWHSRSVGALRPVSIVPQGTAQNFEGCAVFSDVMACAVGRSSVRVVTRTADVKFSRSTAASAVLLL